MSLVIWPNKKQTVESSYYDIYQQLSKMVDNPDGWVLVNNLKKNSPIPLSKNLLNLKQKLNSNTVYVIVPKDSYDDAVYGFKKNKKKSARKSRKSKGKKKSARKSRKSKGKKKSARK